MAAVVVRRLKSYCGGLHAPQEEQVGPTRPRGAAHAGRREEPDEDQNSPRTALL